MEYVVFWRDRWLSQVLVPEIDGVADADSLSCGIYNLVTLVVVEGQADAKPVMGEEVP